MQDLLFPACVDDTGALRLDDRRRFDGAVKVLAGKRVFVRIEQERSRRSLKQLATWWGLWLDIVARDTGSDPDELHEYCKQHFLPARHIQFVNAAGEFAEGEIRTTRKLTTMEMADWMEHGRAWIQAFFGITLPEPDPNWRQHEDEAFT